MNYTGIRLTNSHNINESLSNEQFDDCYLFKEDILDCETPVEALKVIKSHKPIHNFLLFRDNPRKTIFKAVDRLGNIKYLELIKN